MKFKILQPFKSVEDYLSQFLKVSKKIYILLECKVIMINKQLKLMGKKQI